MSAPHTLYLDCFSGISGDMLLSALLGCGLDESVLRGELAKLPIDSFELSISSKTVSGIGATTLAVTAATEPRLRTLPDIETLLAKSSLSEPVVNRCRLVFRRLAEAEAKVHQQPIERVHFHEVGALDTIVDVVGAIVALDALGVDRVISAPLPLGRGFVKCAHGRLPLPAPAVCELLEGIPVVGIEADFELVTPTGAALLRELVDEFGPLPSMTMIKTGYGAGSHPGSPDRPNLLRAILGQAREVKEAQDVVVIETNLDDWNPEGFDYVCGKLLDQGALDVSLSPLHMKKSRPGFCLQVICRPSHQQPLMQVILSETSAIGLRFRREQRYTLARSRIEVATPWGPVTAKYVEKPHGAVIYPEYEACRRVAVQQKVPLAQVYQEVYRAAPIKTPPQ
jgi:uncharacterized protein (TIGR00299 family) protein